MLWSGFILTGKSSASGGPLQPVVCRAFVSASNRRLTKADSSQAENALVDKILTLGSRSK
jgi:hypothetical protein